MNGLDLFAGSGIGSLAFKHTIPGYRTVCYVENDPYCQAVLVARIKDGLLEDAPIWDDVRTFDGTKWCGKVDIVSGGFPCQPFSVAGQRKGDADKRNLWPDTVRIIGEVRPRYAFLENVPGLLVHEYIRRIFGDLAEIGYDCEWDVVSAAFVGAPHLRKRLWILAYTTNGRREMCRAEREKQGTKNRRSDTLESTNILADTTSERFRKERANCRRHSERLTRSSSKLAYPKTTKWWGTDPADDSRRGDTETGGCGKPINKSEHGSVKSSMGRVAHGIPFRVDRLKMLGNAWVPQVVARILMTGKVE